MVPLPDADIALKQLDKTINRLGFLAKHHPMHPLLPGWINRLSTSLHSLSVLPSIDGTEAVRLARLLGTWTDPLPHVDVIATVAEELKRCGWDDEYLQLARTICSFRRYLTMHIAVTMPLSHKCWCFMVTAKRIERHLKQTLGY